MSIDIFNDMHLITIINVSSNEAIHKNILKIVILVIITNINLYGLFIAILV